MELKDFTNDAANLAPWVNAATARWAQLMLYAGRLYHGLFSASSISMTETNILLYLVFKPENHSEPSQLADAMHLSRQTMTGLLDRLEKSGLIHRKPHKTDRRRTRVIITPRGENVIRDFGRTIFNRDAAFINQYPKEAVESTLSVFESLLERIDNWVSAHQNEGQSPEKVPGTEKAQGAENA